MGLPTCCSNPTLRIPDADRLADYCGNCGKPWKPAPPADPREQGEKCGVCKARNRTVFWLPDHCWFAPSGVELMCVGCADAAARAAGIELYWTAQPNKFPTVDQD